MSQSFYQLRSKVSLISTLILVKHCFIIIDSIFQMNAVDDESDIGEEKEGVIGKTS